MTSVPKRLFNLGNSWGSPTGGFFEFKELSEASELEAIVVLADAGKESNKTCRINLDGGSISTVKPASPPRTTKPEELSKEIAKLLTVPATPNDAPNEVDLRSLHSDFAKLWADSFPLEKSQERGGSIVIGSDGKLEITNLVQGKQGNIALNLEASPGKKVVGAFHTHPYDVFEDCQTGISFSGEDVASAINDGHNVEVVQSGREQFMLMRTTTTPEKVDYELLKHNTRRRISKLRAQGYSLKTAVEQATIENARKYNLAYYEGTGGVLRRVFPPLTK